MDGAIDGGCADVGSGPPKIAVVGVGVEGSGEGGSKGGIRSAGLVGRR